MTVRFKMKLTTSQVTAARLHRRPGKGSSYKKLMPNIQKSFNGSKREIARGPSPCDNSDDSGLGIENSPEYLYNTSPHPSVFRFTTSQKRSAEESFVLNSKRHRGDLKIDNFLNDPYSFSVVPSSLSSSNSISCPPFGFQNSIPAASKAMRRSLASGKRFPGPITLSSQLNSTSRNGKVQLQILNQPEQQHRARYQTEGSRGAVKDRTGNSFPVVKIVGYDKLTTLQVFIGSDQGRVTPHMFYQACRVTGKNSTLCTEKNIDGTIVIEIDVDPTRDMIVTCDCVGILKERNVDVEHRFPEECSTRSKKKPTRCRMVFRTLITNDDGSSESLQVASQPIACTQPPGIPEICKKSLTSSPVNGGKELFILGKNFLKDTQVLFQTEDWKQSVYPDKEFLQQTHLVCVVPPYKIIDTTEPVLAKISVVSGNRASEPHSFTYIPLSSTIPASNASSITSDVVKCSNSETSNGSDSVSGPNGTNKNTANTCKTMLDGCENVRPVMLWSSSHTNCNIRDDAKMMPPPIILPRRSSVQIVVPENMTSSVKSELSNTASDIISASPISSQLANVPIQPNTFASSSFSNLSQIPTIIPDFTHNFHSISEVESTLETDPSVVAKVEPLSDTTSLPCSVEPFTMKTCNDVETVCLATSRKTDLYSNTDNFIYQTSANPNVVYPKSVPHVTTQAESRSSEELTTYDVSPNTQSMTSSSTASDLMLSSSSAVLKPNQTINFINNATNLSISSTAMLPPSMQSEEDTKISQMIAMNEHYELDKLITQQQQQQEQQLTPCMLKQSGSYDNLHSAVCFENVPTTAESTSVVNIFPTYASLENESTLATPNASLMYTKAIENEATVVATSSLPRSVSDSGIILESSSMPFKNSLESYNGVISAAKTQNTFLDSQTQEAVISDYVSPPLDENPVNTVPKLEELVNSTAENYIRSSNQSVNSLSLDSNANCVANSVIELGTYLTEPERGNSIINNAICSNVTNSDEVCVTESSLSSATYPCNAIIRTMNLSSSTLTNGEMRPMPLQLKEIKEEKTIGSVPPEMKKTVEGMFQSEISRMTDNDLLRYINPSCFDEVL